MPSDVMPAACSRCDAPLPHGGECQCPQRPGWYVNDGLRMAAENARLHAENDELTKLRDALADENDRAFDAIRELRATAGIAYRLAHLYIVGDVMYPGTWAVRVMDVLAELRELDPERYDREVPAAPSAVPVGGG